MDSDRDRESEHYDDDLLAAAMAEEAVRLGLTGAISIMPPPTGPAVSTPRPPPHASAVAFGPGAPDEPAASAASDPDLSGSVAALSESAPVVPVPWLSVGGPSVGGDHRDSTTDAPPESGTSDESPQPLRLAELPAPSGPPVVFPAEDAEPMDENSLPTRRAIRDAEHARIREGHSRRGGLRESPVAPVSPTVPPLVPGILGQVPRSPIHELVDQVDPFPVVPPVPPAIPVDPAIPAESVLPASQHAERVAGEPVGASVLGDRPVYKPRVVPSESLDDVEDQAWPTTTTNPWLQSVPVVVEPPRRAGSPFAPEVTGSQPTPLDRRIGGATRLFWLWFAANSSVISLAFGAALFSLGMSLRQAVVAAFVGVAISFLPLGLGTLAGKWSGQPTMIVSRATFGVIGNVVPSTVAIVTRLFWGAVLLWLIAASTARILVGAKLGAALSELQLMVIVMAVGFLIAVAVAVFGYPLLARIQFALSIASAVLILVFIGITWRAVDLTTALTVRDGPVLHVVTGVVLVFSFVGLVWATSTGDLARYQRPSSSGGASMLWASFGTTLPAFLLIGYGAVLAASSPATARGLTNSPLDTIAGLLPSWYPLPLIAATVLSLLSGVALSIYSGGLALGSLGFRLSRGGATVVVGILMFAVAIALGFTVTNVVTVFRDLATTLSVPVAAWAGLFAAEMTLRRRRFDTPSLLARGGVYPDVNWINLSMLVVASVIGFGFTSATVAGLQWEGYLFAALGVPLSSPLGGTDLGVLVALLLGLLTPLVSGVHAIRRQERRAVAPG